MPGHDPHTEPCVHAACVQHRREAAELRRELARLKIVNAIADVVTRDRRIPAEVRIARLEHLLKDEGH